jgi:hypothetical protein
MSSDKEFDEPVVDGSARSLLRYARWLEAKGDPRGIHLRLDLARVPELRPPSDADDVELYTNEDWLKIDPRPPVTTRADGVLVGETNAWSVPYGGRDSGNHRPRLVRGGALPSPRE